MINGNWVKGGVFGLVNVADETMRYEGRALDLISWESVKVALKNAGHFHFHWARNQSLFDDTKYIKIKLGVYK